MRTVFLTLTSLVLSLFFLSVKAQESSISVGGEVRACELTIKLIPEVKYNSNLYIIYDSSGVEVFRFQSQTDASGVVKVDFCSLGYQLKAGTYTILLQQESGTSQSFYNLNLFNSYSSEVTLNIEQSSNITILLCCCCCCWLLILLLLILLFIRRRRKKEEKKTHKL